MLLSCDFDCAALVPLCLRPTSESRGGATLNSVPIGLFITDGQNSQGLSLQLAGSAPIFSPRSARLFIVSFLNTPGTGGDQSGGMDTTRTSTSALRLSSEISAIAKRCLIAVAVAARVDVSRLR